MQRFKQFAPLILCAWFGLLVGGLIGYFWATREYLDSKSRLYHHHETWESLTERRWQIYLQHAIDGKLPDRHQLLAWIKEDAEQDRQLAEALHYQMKIELVPLRPFPPDPHSE